MAHRQKWGRAPALASAPFASAAARSERPSPAGSPGCASPSTPPPLPRPAASHAAPASDPPFAAGRGAAASPRRPGASAGDPAESSVRASPPPPVAPAAGASPPACTACTPSSARGPGPGAKVAGSPGAPGSDALPSRVPASEDRLAASEAASTCASVQSDSEGRGVRALGVPARGSPVWCAKPGAGPLLGPGRLPARC